MTIDERRAQVLDRAQAGASTRAIAAALGLPQRTVARDVAALTATGALDPTRRVIGYDGRRHPATKRHRRPRGPLAAHRYEPRPFPFADLEHAAGSAGATVLARRLSVHPAQVHRWRRSGLTVDQADELAGRLCRHPAEVWPRWA